jgi:hypothetical protein
MQRNQKARLSIPQAARHTKSLNSLDLRKQMRVQLPHQLIDCLRIFRNTMKPLNAIGPGSILHAEHQPPASGIGECAVVSSALPTIFPETRLVSSSDDSGSCSTQRSTDRIQS